LAQPTPSPPLAATSGWLWTETRRGGASFFFMAPAFWGEGLSWPVEGQITASGHAQGPDTGRGPGRGSIRRCDSVSAISTASDFGVEHDGVRKPLNRPQATRRTAGEIPSSTRRWSTVRRVSSGKKRGAQQHSTARLWLYSRNRIEVPWDVGPLPL